MDDRIAVLLHVNDRECSILSVRQDHPDHSVISSLSAPFREKRRPVQLDQVPPVRSRCV